MAIVTLGGLQKVDATAWGSKSPALMWIAELAAREQSHIWWQLPLLAILAGLLGLLRKHLGSPWIWSTVKFALDDIRKSAFADGESDGHHYHRVTLFKYVGWAWCFRRWPWSGWLVPVERSGHTTLSGVSIFKAPDSADNAEGIAGQAWARAKTVRVTDLPDLANSPSLEDISRYAGKTWIATENAGRRLPKSRSLMGLPVEVKGRLWGVIVLDSRNPQGIKSDVVSQFQSASRLLAKLLEKL